MLSTPLFTGFLKMAAVAVSLGGLTAGAVFAYQTTRGGDESVAGQTTVTATSATTPPPATPSLTAEPQTPEPTASATTEPPPTSVPPTPTPDTRVPMRDLPTLEQIQLGKDGEYFIADRGDGCTWTEYSRTVDPHFGLEVQFSTDCPADFGFTYRPASGEVVLFGP